MHLYPAAAAAVPYWVPPEKRAGWYLFAESLKLESGATSNAMLAFSQAINLDPTNVAAYVSRGAARIDVQDFTGALVDIQKAMALSPSDETAIFSRGVCKFGLKDFNGADADFTTAINLETNDYRVYNYRGLARANLRDFQGALEDLDRAIEISPRDAMVYRNRAMVESLQKEYELALADASKSIELDGHDALAYAARGRVRIALKEYQPALMDFDKAIELNPKDALSHASRGTAKIYMDDFENAAMDLEKALQLDPKSMMAFIARGVLKAKRGGEDDAALVDLKRAVELAPQVPETYGMLGLFEYKAFQWEQALANCRKALKLGTLANVSDLNSYIWLILAQRGEKEAANNELDTYLKSLDQAKTNDWSAITARFFSGSLAESNFLGLATTSAKRPSDVQSQVCESFYYAGMKRKLAGDKQGAEDLFQKCIETKYDNTIAYLNATVELRALKQPPR